MEEYDPIVHTAANGWTWLHDTGGTPHLVQGQRLLPWRHAGYGAAVDRPRGIDVEVLTPKLSVATLHAGFKPRLHATATDPKI